MTAEQDSSPSDESRQVSGALPTEGTSVICWTTGGGVGGLPQTNNPTGVVGRASPCSRSRLLPGADRQRDKLTGISGALREANEDFLRSGGVCHLSLCSVVQDMCAVAKRERKVSLLSMRAGVGAGCPCGRGLALLL